jgi:hypothetical protein
MRNASAVMYESGLLATHLLFGLIVVFEADGHS